MDKSTRLRRVYYLLTYLYWFALALPVALIVLIVQSRGLSLIELSILFGVHALTVFLLEVPTGSLADVIGRKPVTVWAALLMIIGFSMFLLFFSFPLLLLGGIVYGVSRALASGALDAWFIDEVQALDPEIEIHPLIARAGVVTLGGLASGTLVGGLLPSLLPFLPAEGTAILTPFSSTLLASVVIQALRLALIVRLVEESPRRTTEGTLRQILVSVPNFARTAAGVARENGVIRGLLVTSFAAGFVMFGLENLWQPRFATLLGGSAGNSLVFGVIMTGNFLLAAAGNMLSIWLGKRLGGRLGLVAGLSELFRGAALLLLALQVDWMTAAALFWLVYLGMGLSEAPAATIFNIEVPAAYRSSLLSIRSMVAYLGLFAGSLVLGLVAERASIAVAWMVGGVVLLVLFIPYWRIDRYYSLEGPDHSGSELPLMPREEEINAG